MLSDDDVLFDERRGAAMRADSVEAAGVFAESKQASALKRDIGAQRCEGSRRAGRSRGLRARARSGLEA